jgi:Uma2 family endonuclease
MVIQTKRYTVEEFEAFLDANDGKYELVGGEIIELGSNAYSSSISAEIVFHLKSFLRENNLQGHVTTEAGLYRVGDSVYAPDVAYLSFEKQARLDKESANHQPPELAIEVISPNDRPAILSLKIVNYLNAGVVVWAIDPENRNATVYIPGRDGVVIDVDGVLDGGDILPGFKLLLKHIFPD